MPPLTSPAASVLLLLVSAAHTSTLAPWLEEAEGSGSPSAALELDLSQRWGNHIIDIYFDLCCVWNQ